MKHLEGLNEAQKKAVLDTEGPLLIVAGAGAGKTKTIAHRIINLVNKGVDPKKILAITFTNKAAKEMRERVIKLLATESKGTNTDFPLYETPTVKTFHALGVQILKDESRALGLPKHFSILDEGESTALIKEVILELSLDPKQFEPKRMKYLISRQKGDFITAESFLAGSEGYFPEILARIWMGYENKLKSEKALDFDDLILKTVRLLKENKEIGEKYRNRWEYLHIDEYQDTNEAQYELSKLLINDKKNICVVGDSDQNIYSWRGANIKNILNFEKDYPGANVVYLEENYRSTQNILLAANSIIKKNTIRKDKTLFTKNKTGEKIGIFEAFDENDEAIQVAERVRLIIDSGVSPEKISILYRANFQSRVFEESFFNKGIPYQVLGTKFFQRKEVKDVLSYIKLALNADSSVDLKRILNVPPRGLGKVALVKVISGKENELPTKTKEKIKDFRKIIEKIKDSSLKLSPSSLVKEVIKISGLDFALKDGTEEDKERLSNMYELASLALRYDGMKIDEGLNQFLEDAALFSDQDTLDDKSKDSSRGVKFMTVHSAKGLEFSHVFIVGLEQDLFPHARTSGAHVEKEDEEEERRLFYVALTRAEEKLHLSYAMMRTVFGSRQINTPSEFIFDIPPEIMENEERIETSGKVVFLD